MKNKLICGDKYDNIVQNNLKYSMEYITSYNAKKNKCTKKYYKLGKNKIEVIMINMEEDNISQIDFNNEDKELLILNEINDNNIQIISKLSKNRELIVLALKNNLSNKNNLNSDVLKKVIILNVEKSKININLILDFILENDFIENNKEQYLILGCEEENPLGNIPINILKKCKDIYKYKKLTINLYLSKEYNLQELSYIKDPITEYMDNDSNLIIKQIRKKDIDNKVHFTVLIEYKN